MSIIPDKSNGIVPDREKPNVHPALESGNLEDLRIRQLAHILVATLTGSAGAGPA
jgi:hypothetical protein